MTGTLPLRGRSLLTSAEQDGSGVVGVVDANANVNAREHYIGPNCLWVCSIKLARALN